MNAGTSRFLPEGGVTSPREFVAGATYAGIKTYGPEPRLDVALLASSRPAVGAGVFTKNRIVGAPVELCRRHLQDGRARAIVVNSGCSNVAMGERGRRDAHQMATLAAKKLGLSSDEVLVASTGVIGRRLPMPALERAINEIELSESGGGNFARAIMTTDTIVKQRALSVSVEGRTYTVGGAAKGAGMVHPDMATVLCFLTTDAPADPQWLRATLASIADVSLNMIDVDMDTSTSDSMIVLANGAAGGDELREGHPASELVKEGLTVLAIELARALVRDAEGAKTLIEVVVKGAHSVKDARAAARTISSSPLVKTMVTGRDPNLGRVMMALGRSGADVDVTKTSVWIGKECAFANGAPADVDYDALSKAMDHDEVRISVDLGLGSATATAWGCDLTEDYVRINADYTT